jgi:tetratricopeptide (TPR) repeat protein
MFKQDYLLKLIEEVGRVAAQVMGYRQRNAYDEALQLLGETYEAFFPFNGEQLGNTEEEDLISWLVEEHGLEVPQLEVVADLLREEAEVYFQQGDWEDGQSRLHKALRVLQHLNQSQPTLYSFVRYEKIAALQARLRQPDDAASPGEAEKPS